MKLDVVVPVTRTKTIGRLLKSLSLGTSQPDVVTLVSNEVPSNTETFGLPVRIIRFSSDTVPIGYGDAAVRRNVGIWASSGSHVITLDDDLVAPANLVATSRDLLCARPYFWGHYRYIRFTDHSIEDLVTLPPESGQTREYPPNAWHLWTSCYGGLFGVKTDVLREIGGFDLVFSCRHSNCDQQLGRRLARRIHGTDRVYIHEPPFAWHPTDPEPWGPPVYRNICSTEHQTFDSLIGAMPVQRCAQCPWISITDEGRLFDDTVHWAYNPDQLEVDIIQLNASR